MHLSLRVLFMLLKWNRESRSISVLVAGLADGITNTVMELSQETERKIERETCLSCFTSLSRVAFFAPLIFVATSFLTFLLQLFFSRAMSEVQPRKEINPPWRGRRQQMTYSFVKTESFFKSSLKSVYVDTETSVVVERMYCSHCMSLLNHSFWEPKGKTNNQETDSQKWNTNSPDQDSLTKNNIVSKSHKSPGKMKKEELLLLHTWSLIFGWWYCCSSLSHFSRKSNL